MPRYDYQCLDDECKHIQEEIHSIHKDPEYLCDECGCATKRVVLEPPGVHFKGFGWPGEDGKKSRNAGERRDKIKQKERDMGRGDMVPNVEGEVANTWMDAAHLATEKDKDPTPFVAKAVSTGEDIEKV